MTNHQTNAGSQELTALANDLLACRELHAPQASFRTRKSIRTDGMEYMACLLQLYYANIIPPHVLHAPETSILLFCLDCMQRSQPSPHPLY